MRFPKYLVALVAISSFLNTSVKADFIVSVTDGDLMTYVPEQVPVYQAGETVNLGVWLYDENPAGRQVSAFNLAFDLGASGIGFDSDFFGFNAVPTAPFSTGFNFDETPTGAVDFDFLVSAAGNADVTIAGVDSPARLFNLTFATDANTTPGIYDFVFVPNAQMSGILGPGPANNLDPANIPLAALGGQFEIVAVPEPGSVLALAGLVGLVGMRRRRKVLA
jgi:hypothetical protein